MIVFRCVCGRKLRVQDSAAGKKGKCPACGGEMTVPAVSERETPISCPLQSTQLTTPPPQQDPSSTRVRTSGSATASLIFGILSAFCLGCITGIPAIILGIFGILDTSTSQVRGRGMAVTGIVLGSVFTVVMISFQAGIILPMITAAQHKAEEVRQKRAGDGSDTIIATSVNKESPEEENPQQPMPTTASFTILGIDSKVTEANTSWSRFAWKLTIRNNTGKGISFKATIEFQDADGFIIDTTRDRGYLPPNAEETYTGFALINADTAGNVAQTVAKVERSLF